MDDETLRFIRQRRPRLQCKRRTTEHGASRRERRRDSAGQGREESEEEEGRIVEFSPQNATRPVEEDDFPMAAESDPKQDNDQSVRQEKPGKESKTDPSSLKIRPLAAVKKDVTSADSFTAHPALSPMESSGTTYTPKSSSSTGHIWKFPAPDYEHRQCPDKHLIQSLSELDNRLESLHERMHKFESDLFTTVDSILHLLGQKPKVTRDSVDFDLPPAVSHKDDNRAPRPPLKGPPTTLPPHTSTQETNRVLANSNDATSKRS
ncbi:hypothetical protein ACOMHN_043304 [Nucella lapillus]